MWKISLLLAIGCICVASQETTVSPRNRDICRRQNTRCVRNQERLGTTNDVTTAFNNQCRRSNRSWSEVTRCQLADATCQLTLERCRTLSCNNVRRALQSGPTNPTPRTRTTRRPTRTPRPTRSSRPTRTPRTRRPTRTTRRPPTEPVE
ncbi:uncharacterized protein LOC117580475 isoform X2 [Drosophila guanche]|uniref:uncharacterized protein LOC117580475 isoform X2 n=1 Tax=Drosophila guanche TaxID=7266 RepID=UPI001471E581|nr:uncharacterized protein LOC117580475 isoform X2 [Drosophila guanche]